MHIRFVIPNNNCQEGPHGLKSRSDEIKSRSQERSEGASEKVPEVKY